MTTQDSLPTSVQDYSEAMIRIQQLNRDMHRQIQAKDFDGARNTARQIAVDAMLVAIWCKQFVQEQTETC